MKRKKLLLLIINLAVITVKIGAQNIISVPLETEKWLQTCLQKNKGKIPLAHYNNDEDFFSTDSARVIGYLKGYKLSEGFKTGVIDMENEFSRIEYPIVVKIWEDGRFEARIPMWYPKIVSVDFNNQSLEFYIEPGQTLGIIVDWSLIKKNDKDPKAIAFVGDLSEINRSRNAFPLLETDQDWLSKQVRKVKPEAFKKETLKVWVEQGKILDSLLKSCQANEKQKALAHAELNINILMRLHDYIALRDAERRNDSNNAFLQAPLSADYYDFINRISSKDNSIFIPGKFAWLINRMEYGPLFKAANLPDSEYWITGLDKVVRLDKTRDSIAYHELFLKHGKLYDLIRLHRIASAFRFELRSTGSDTLINYLATIKGGLYNKFYQQQAEIILDEALRNRDPKGRELPPTNAGLLFKSLIAPYAGKIIVVDFWATTCPSCVYDIQQLYETRLRYKDEDDLVFLFITSEDESPRRAYQSFIKKQKLSNTRYINVDDFMYLRELFGIKGIPRSVIISREGTVLNDNFQMHNLKSEIGNYLPQYSF